MYEAITYQRAKKKQKLAGKATALEWDLTRIALPKKPKGPAPPGVALLDNVERLANRMGASDVYIPFMVESAYVHPSALSADAYFRPEGPATTAEVGGTPLRTSARLALAATTALLTLVEMPEVRAFMKVNEAIFAKLED